MENNKSAEDIVNGLIGTFELADGLGKISSAVVAVVLANREMYKKNGVCEEQANDMALDSTAITLNFIAQLMPDIQKGDIG